MIEIALAMSMASTAMGNIKKGIELGRQFRDVVGEFGKLLDARDSIVEAQRESGEQTVVDNATQQAISTAIMIRDINYFETWLKDQLIYSGQADVYMTFVEERVKIRKANLAARRAAEAAQRKRQQEIAEAVDLSIALVIAFVILGVLLWGGWELFAYCKATQCGK